MDAEIVRRVWLRALLQEEKRVDEWFCACSTNCSCYDALCSACVQLRPLVPPLQDAGVRVRGCCAETERSGKLCKGAMKLNANDDHCHKRGVYLIVSPRSTLS